VRTIEGSETAIGWRGRWRRHGQAGVVLAVGFLITAGLTVSSALSYAKNERRLTSLETRLTASVLQTAQPQLQATLGRVIGLTATAKDHVATFRAEMAGELAPQGQFSSATLAVVQAGQVRILGHIGTAPLQELTSKATTQVFLQASRTSSLVTNRVVAGGAQKLGYLLSARGPDGVYVVGASQQLPTGHRVSVPSGSPDSNLNFALYFGPSATPAALIETNAARLPLTGTVTQATVPFGNNVLTLVASPRGPLAGRWAQYLPWGILGLGIAFSLGAAVITENLIRRRRTTESLYLQQRRMSETLQRSLLPRRLPAVPGWDFAARYVPAAQGAEIGGDWYSVVEVDDHRFAIVVGDVSGHDMAAAGVMAALRYTIRALAKQGIPPNEVLDQASQELDVATDGHFATALIGLVDTGRHEMVLASAGHPPPLIVTDGRSEYVGLIPGLPLGVRGGPRPAPTTVPVPPGATIVAFTDGLVEKRTQSLDTGLSQLARAAAGTPSGPDDLIDQVLERLSSGDQEDDIAVLAVHLSSPDASRRAVEPRSDETMARDPAPI
jgi:Stage II sporulation protein E (SpoIIE)